MTFCARSSRHRAADNSFRRCDHSPNRLAATVRAVRRALTPWAHEYIDAQRSGRSIESYGARTRSCGGYGFCDLEQRRVPQPFDAEYQIG